MRLWRLEVYWRSREYMEHDRIFVELARNPAPLPTEFVAWMNAYVRRQLNK